MGSSPNDAEAPTFSVGSLTALAWLSWTLVLEGTGWWAAMMGDGWT